MHLYLVHKMQELKVEPAYFFRLAHQWRFGREADLTRDALEYKLCGIVPMYVEQYVHHLQEGERNVVQKV